MEEYDIFLSCKSEDYELAEEVYFFLRNNGFRTFLSSKELRRMAIADYMEAISSALDSASHLIVLANKKEYVTSTWVKYEWSTFLNEILSNRKNGQIMTLLSGLAVKDLPIQLRKFESFSLQNYKQSILPYLGKPYSFAISSEEDAKGNAINPMEPQKTGDAELHIETDIPCYVFRFKELLIEAKPDDDNLIYLKKGSHKLTFVSTDNENDCYSLVYAVKDDCEFLQVSLAKIRDARVAAEEAERRAKEEAERRVKEEAERRIIEVAKIMSAVEVDANFQRCEENGLYGFKLFGTIVIPAKYDFADSFSEGLARVEFYGKYGFVDNRGKEVIPLQYNYAYSFSYGLAVVKLGYKWGYIEKSGKEVIPLKYDSALSFREGLAMVKLNNKWGFVDKTGKEVISLMYENVGSFSEGLAMVKLVGKWGYIDKSGKEVIPLKYDSADSFCNGFAKVKLKGKKGHIDKLGNFTPDE